MLPLVVLICRFSTVKPYRFPCTFFNTKSSIWYKYSLTIWLKWQLDSVRPDWVIFEGSWRQILIQNSPNCDLLGILKNFVLATFYSIIWMAFWNLIVPSSMTTIDRLHTCTTCRCCRRNWSTVWGSCRRWQRLAIAADAATTSRYGGWRLDLKVKSTY